MGNTARPFSLLLDLRACDWYPLRRELVTAIAESGSAALIKVGLIVPPLPSGPVAVTMSRYEENKGRSITQTQNAFLPLYQASLLRQLLGEVDIRFRRDERIGYAEIQNAECFSISAVDDELSARLVRICSAQSALVLAAHWNIRDSVSADLMWNGLILRNIITQGLVITDYEEYPDNVDYSGDVVGWSPERKPEPGYNGFFYSESGGAIVESRLQHLPIPSDLETSKLNGPPRTPLQTALRQAGRRAVTRISDHDTRDSIAEFRLPYLHLQFPDVLKVEEKVRKYCLNKTHPARKWVGFAEHGYGNRDTDSIVLASYLSSALLEKFEPTDVVATSKRELQFSVGIAVPSATRHRALLRTAWIAEPSTGFRLTTAYVDRSRASYADAMPVWESNVPIEDAWLPILDTANRRVADWSTDGVNARPRVFIPRSGMTRSLARDLVKSGAGHGTFQRRALGGRCLLVPAGPNMSWLQAAFVACFVQVQLGMRGITSMSDVWVD